MAEDRFPNRNRKPRWRRPLRQAMKASGVVPPTRQWIWSVEPKAIRVPDWAREVSVRGLTQLEGQIWLWPVDAKQLVAEDRAQGGRPRVNVTEVRFCKLCSRPLVGVEAARRRQLDLSGPGGRFLPCALSCTRDDGTGVWRRLVDRRKDQAA